METACGPDQLPSSPKRIPIVCPGHSRPLTELSFCPPTTVSRYSVMVRERIMMVVVRYFEVVVDDMSRSCSLEVCSGKLNCLFI